MSKIIQAVVCSTLALALNSAFSQSAATAHSGDAATAQGGDAATAHGGDANADQQRCLMTAAKTSFGREAYHMRTIGEKEVFAIPVSNTTQYGNGFLNLKQTSTVHQTLVVDTKEGNLSFFTVNPYEVNASTLKSQWIELTGKNSAIAYGPTLKIGSGQSPWVDSFADEVRSCAQIGMKR